VVRRVPGSTWPVIATVVSASAGAGLVFPHPRLDLHDRLRAHCGGTEHQHRKETG